MMNQKKNSAEAVSASEQAESTTNVNQEINEEALDNVAGGAQINIF